MEDISYNKDYHKALKKVSEGKVICWCYNLPRHRSFEGVIKIAIGNWLIDNKLVGHKETEQFGAEELYLSQKGKELLEKYNEEKESKKKKKKV